MAVTFIILFTGAFFFQSNLFAAIPNNSQISILPLNSLSFGKFAVNSMGTITISSNGVRSRSGGAALFASANGASARFEIRGNSGQIFNISLPSNGEAQLTSGSFTMPLENFTCSPSTVGVLDHNGVQVVTIGASLIVGAGKQAGDYQGSFPIVVDYQ